MKTNNLFLFLIITINIKLSQNRRYDNFLLFCIRPTEKDQLHFLQSLESQKYIDVIFWKRPSKLYNDVHLLVNAGDLENFQERVTHFNINTNMMLQDVQSAFDAQTIKRYTRLRIETFDWENYHDLEDINQWLADTASKFPETVQLISIGKSVEGRDIYALEVKKSKSRAKVIIDGGIHGNEWISISCVTYLANQLIRAEEIGDSRLIALSKNYQWFFIPIVNPDGFMYSIKEDRLWRKNRRKYDSGVGVDLNRNFDYNFGSYSSSNSSTDDNYCGPSPFSEPESQALSNFIRLNSDRLNFYFSFHAYGQKLIIPYDDRVVHVENFSEMENFGKQAILKMYKMHKTKYSVGTTFDTFGLRSSGCSASWVKKNIKSKYVVTFVLRDNGTYGYALPNTAILPTCQETMEGLITLMTARPKRVRANLFSAAAVSSPDMLLLFLLRFLSL